MYADDVTLISTDVDAHFSVSQTIVRKAADLDLSFKPAKCVFYTCLMVIRLLLKVQLARLLMHHLLKRLLVQKLQLTSPVYYYLLTLSGLVEKYKHWIYTNYIISLLRFNLCVDAVSNSIITQLESSVCRYLKSWLHLLRSATRVAVLPRYLLP